MKISILNTKDSRGGAARAASRINRALNQQDVSSKLVVQSKVGGNPMVEEVHNTKFQKALAKIRPRVDDVPAKLYRKKKEVPFSVAKIGIDVTKISLVRNADIINLHWINGGFLSTRSIKKLGSLTVPIVWTLHDMWPFTGGCHYSGGCDKYIENCGSCPILRSNKNRDLTRRIWNRKRKAYQDVDLHIVTPSTWLADLAKKSTLFEGLQVQVIPNCLDTDIYKPIEKELARNILNLPKAERLVLFGAVSATSGSRKGFRYLRKSMELLQREKGFTAKSNLLVFGASHDPDISDFPFEVNFLGHLYDEYTLALAYNAADVFVAPSLQDNLPNTVMESLSCGTPVVGFETGGIPDMVSHKENGYLANYKSVEDLTAGIKWILKSEKRQQKLGQDARKKVLNNYTYEQVSQQYLDFYKELI